MRLNATRCDQRPPCGVSIDPGADLSETIVTGDSIFLSRYVSDRRRTTRFAATLHSTRGRVALGAMAAIDVAAVFVLTPVFSAGEGGLGLVPFLAEEVAAGLLLAIVISWAALMCLYFGRAPAAAERLDLFDGEVVGRWRLQLFPHNWFSVFDAGDRKQYAHCRVAQVFGLCETADGAVAAEVRDTPEGESRLIPLTGTISRETADWLRGYLARRLETGAPEGATAECA